MKKLMKKIEDEDIKTEFINFYILCRRRSEKTEKRVFYVKINDKLSECIKKLAVNFIKKITNDTNYNEREYCPVTNYDEGEIEYIDLNEISMFETINVDIMGDTRIFSKENIRGYEPYVYICDFRFHDNSHFLLFQHIRGKKIFKKGLLIGRFNNEFSKVTDLEDIYLIDDVFDCLAWKKNLSNNEESNFMYIFNKKRFDWIFGFEEKFKNELDKKFKKIIENSKEELIDEDEFLNFVKNDYYALRKTFKLIKNGNFKKYFNKDVLDKMEEEKIVKFDWTEDCKLVINRDNIKRLLKVLDEDYLKSIISDDIFVSLSKRSL